MLIRQNYVSRLTTIFGPSCLGIPHGLDSTLTRASGRGRDERAVRNFEMWGSAKEMDPDFKKTIPNSRGKLLLNLSIGRLAGFKTGKYEVCLTIIH